MPGLIRILKRHSGRNWFGAFHFRYEIFDCIDYFYNYHRKHRSLGYRDTAQFEAQIHSLN